MKPIWRAGFIWPPQAWTETGEVVLWPRYNVDPSPLDNLELGKRAAEAIGLEDYASILYDARLASMPEIERTALPHSKTPVPKAGRARPDWRDRP